MLAPHDEVNMDIETVDKLKELIFNAYDREDSVGEARELVSGFLPARLFKYRGVSDYSLDNFKLDTLFCAKADSFNDPFDCSLSLHGPDSTLLLVKSLKALGMSSNDNKARITSAADPIRALTEVVEENGYPMSEAEKKAFIDNIKKTVNEPRDLLNSKIRRSCNICSLSERIDSLPMWAHYGDDHKGFAMEYDISAFPLDHEARESLWPVLYGHEMYDVTQQIFGRPVQKFNQLFLVGGAIHKSSDWQYEQEWRIVLPVGADNPAENISVPTPIALYLGAQIDPDDAEKLVGLAKEKNVPVYRMEHSRNQFKMEPVELA